MVFMPVKVVAAKGLKTRMELSMLGPMKTLFQRMAMLAAVFAFAGNLVAQDKTYKIAVIPKGTTHEFWKSIHAGAVKAQRELGEQGVKVELFWKGPLKEDDRDQQIQVVENFTTRRVDGIVLAPLDSQALIAPVVNATKAKIPVVIFDSDLKSDKQVSFVATDNYKGGCMAAEQMGKLLNGKGNVIMLRYAVGSASTEGREAGFLDTLKAKFPDIKVISSDQYGGPTRETAYQTAQNLLNRHGREVDGVFGSNETTAVGIIKAVRDIGKGGGKIKAVGFDGGTQLVSDLNKGDAQALVVQNPMRMGYLGVMTLVKHIRGETVEKRVDTGVMVVTPENKEEQEIKDLLNPPLSKYLD